jgi:hypothetical protein
MIASLGLSFSSFIAFSLSFNLLPSPKTSSSELLVASSSEVSSFESESLSYAFSGMQDKSSDKERVRSASKGLELNFIPLMSEVCERALLIRSIDF